jgi:hypothetical protein
MRLLFNAFTSKSLRSCLLAGASSYLFDEACDGALSVREARLTKSCQTGTLVTHAISPGVRLCFFYLDDF